jgi:hypothetical protein
MFADRSFAGFYFIFVCSAAGLHFAGLGVFKEIVGRSGVRHKDDLHAEMYALLSAKEVRARVSRMHVYAHVHVYVYALLSEKGVTVRDACVCVCVCVCVCAPQCERGEGLRGMCMCMCMCMRSSVRKR